MRHCSFCNSEVFIVDGCDERKLVFGDDTDGVIRRDPDADDLVDPVPYGEESSDEEAEESCPVCQTKAGHYHHPGCSTEECPNCGELLINCDCNPHTLTREEPEP